VSLALTGERALAPLDALRARLYRWLAPWLGALYPDRARRVAWMGAVSVTVSFAVTVAAPLWLLALGPVLLGVPHLLADVRYLVVRPGLHRCVVPAVLAGAALVAVGLGAPSMVGLAAMLPAILAARASVAAKAVALAMWWGLSVLAWRDEYAFLLGFLHAHNLVALALWWRLRPRDGRAAWTVGLALAGAAALALGLCDGAIAALGGFVAPGTGTDFNAHVEAMAPTAVNPVVGLHLVLSFAFLQSVHYALWLRLIPEDARERPAPRPFRASLRALQQELGWPLLLLFGALALGIALWGAVDLPGARLGYLQLAAFHGYLELAAGAWLLLERRGAAPVPAEAR
jgi:hypothetical protein